MVIMLYFHCKIVNNYPGPNPPNPGLGPRVNPGFGFEKPAGYPGLRGPEFGCPTCYINYICVYSRNSFLDSFKAQMTRCMRQHLEALEVSMRKF